jgi:hypothetical protein
MAPSPEVQRASLIIRPSLMASPLRIIITRPDRHDLGEHDEEITAAPTNGVTT